MRISKIDPKAAIRGMFDEGSEEKEISGETKVNQRKRHHKSRRKDLSVSSEFLSVDQVAQRYTISRATVWRLAKNDPAFPAPFKFTNGTSRWSLKQLRSFERAKEAASKKKGARK